MVMGLLASVQVATPSRRFSVMRFFTFSGRAGRLEYLGIAAAGLVVHLINALIFVDAESFREGGTLIASPLYVIGLVFATVVTWMAAIRRCHDLGRSGFFLLWQIVPIFGVVAMLFVVFARGDDMKNRFGPPPWSVTNRAEKRAELERAALAGIVEQQVNPDEEWVTGDGSFDMNGLWEDSNLTR